jgi:energy-coupling factor transporter ATP-binding protein EcfA2
MILNIKNLGIIESAEIELKGLTVLAGLNDTGKSFISKILYALIKTIKDANIQDLNQRNIQLDSKWINIRNLLNSTKQQDITSLFEKIILPLRVEIINDLSNKMPPEHMVIKINSIRNQINNIPNIAVNVKHQLDNQLNSITEFVSIQKKEEEKYISYFNQTIIQQLFRSQINCLNKDYLLEIVCKEGESQALKLTISNNVLNKFEVDNTFSTLVHLQDAIIIDSPVITQLASLITRNRLEFIRGQDLSMPIYYPDLVGKFIPVGNPVASEANRIIQEDIIGGKVVFEEKTNKIVYQKNNGQQIENYNIATGIKAFGIIQLLLNSGAINKNCLLIIDEPEVHLHPEWQVKFAQIITVLAKEGIPILISSHSPYLLRAIPIFAKKYDIESITKVYFGEKQADKNTSHFYDVSDDLDPIYKAFADPLQNLFLNS